MVATMDMTQRPIRLNYISIDRHGMATTVIDGRALPPMPLMIETDRERITVVPKEPSDDR